LGLVTKRDFDYVDGLLVGATFLGSSVMAGIGPFDLFDINLTEIALSVGEGATVAALITAAALLGTILTNDDTQLSSVVNYVYDLEQKYYFIIAGTQRCSSVGPSSPTCRASSRVATSGGRSTSPALSSSYQRLKDALHEVVEQHRVRPVPVVAIVCLKLATATAFGLELGLQLTVLCLKLVQTCSQSLERGRSRLPVG
jgi:hypothetical protein